MGKFTGKADFYDIIYMHYTPEEIAKATIYCGDAGPLRIDSPLDLIPYSTHLLSSMGAEKGAPEKTCIHLARESYLIQQDEERVQSYISQVLSTRRQPKMKGKTFEECFPEHDKPEFALFNDRRLLRQIWDRFEGNPKLEAFLKKVITKTMPYDKERSFILKWVIPEHFYDCHAKYYIEQMKDFIKFCEEEKGYTKYHPVISGMKFVIGVYERGEQSRD